MSDNKKRILYLSPTKNGKLHDKKQIDKTTIISHVPEEITILDMFLNNVLVNQK